MTANFVPTHYMFDSTSAGVLDAGTITENSTYLDYFLLFFDDELMDFIVTQTNLQYKYIVEKYGMSRGSRLQRWKETDKREMFVFFALMMLMP